MKKILITSNAQNLSADFETISVTPDLIKSTADYYASFDDCHVAVEDIWTARELGISYFVSGEFLNAYTYDFFRDAPKWLQKKHTEQVEKACKVTRDCKRTTLKSIDQIDVNELVEKGGVYLIKVPTGHGKSSRIASPSFSSFITQGKSATTIAPIISICKGFHAKAESETGEQIAYYDSITPESFNSPGLVTTINSSTKKPVALMSKRSDLLIIEEAQKTLNSIAESKDLKGNRTKIWEQIGELIARAKCVLLLDADINDTLVDFVVSAGREPEVMEIPADYGDIDVDLVKMGNLARKAGEAVEAGEKVSICFDSKSRAKKFAKMFESTPGVLLIHADNKGLDQQKEFMENPNANLDSVNLLIYTPVMGSSISIEKEHFDHNFGVFTGIIAPLDCVQMLRRDRTARKFTVCIDAAPTVGKKEEIDCDTEISGIYEIREQNRYLRESIVTSLPITLRHLNFNVIDAASEVNQCDGEAFGRLARASVELQKEEVEAIKQAPKISIDAARKMKMRDDLTESDIAKKEAALISELCGEISDSSIDFYKRGGEQAVELHKVLMMSDEECIALDKKSNSNDPDAEHFFHKKQLLARFMKLGFDFTGEEALSILSEIRFGKTWNKLNIEHLPQSGSMSEKQARQKAAKIWKKLGYKTRTKGEVVKVYDVENVSRYISRHAELSVAV